MTKDRQGLTKYLVIHQLATVFMNIYEHLITFMLYIITRRSLVFVIIFRR